MAAERRTVIQAGGRAKAYRPLPTEERRLALAQGLAAYDRGDFFLAHELLEPAWMGTDDVGERAVMQGLIKLAAAFVHAARGNPAGVGKNLRGAREHLLAPGAEASGEVLGLDVGELASRIAERLIAIDRWTEGSTEPLPLGIRIPRLGRGPGEAS